MKWAGNKYQIVERIKAVLPPGRRLIEPFVGSGAVFLNTDYPEYLLADANPDLTNLYCHLQKGGAEFIASCRAYFTPQNNNPDRFYELRECFNTTTDATEKALLFVYLNKHCYNGLCRYNSKGGFNVPFGKYTKPYFPEEEMLFFWRRSQQAQFVVNSFAQTMEMATLGDVVYCDPPYVPLSDTAHFTSYSSDRFGEQEQLLLAAMAEKLAAKGIPVIISNHDTEFTRSTYENASKSYSFAVQRFISCNGANRNKVDEILAVFC